MLTAAQCQSLTNKTHITGLVDGAKWLVNSTVIRKALSLFSMHFRLVSHGKKLSRLNAALAIDKLHELKTKIVNAAQQSKIAIPHGKIQFLKLF